MYVTLDRLEDKGFLSSRLADATDERGGRPRRYVTVTARGLRELRASRARRRAIADAVPVRHRAVGSGDARRSRRRGDGRRERGVCRSGASRRGGGSRRSAALELKAIRIL
jgi:DNA-binding PadR family transcriptional regulator